MKKGSREAAVGAFIVAASVFGAGTTSAAPVWSAPGWYQVADTIVGLFILKGPFATQGECTPTLPPNEEDADYLCQYLTERPSWDD